MLMWTSLNLTRNFIFLKPDLPPYYFSTFLSLPGLWYAGCRYPTKHYFKAFVIVGISNINENFFLAGLILLAI